MLFLDFMRYHTLYFKMCIVLADFTQPEAKYAFSTHLVREAKLVFVSSTHNCFHYKLVSEEKIRYTYRGPRRVGPTVHTLLQSPRFWTTGITSWLHSFMTIRLWHLWVLIYLASCHVGESHMARLLGAEGNLLATVRKKWKASIPQRQGSEFWDNISELRPKAFPSPAPDDYRTAAFLGSWAGRQLSPVLAQEIWRSQAQVGVSH